MKLHFNELKNNVLDVKLDKRTDVYNWGGDNAFPSLIELLINQSVTSKICVDKVAKAIYGKSYGKTGKLIVNGDGQTLNEVLRIASREYAKNNNLFIHVGYNAELKIKSIKVLPVSSVRVGKADDLGYSGKYLVYDNWNKSNGKIDESKFRVYDRFNPLTNVIESQIEKAGSIMAYKGQILHIQKDSNSIYSLPDLNPVLQEALLEANSQTFRSRGASKGFLNTKLMVVQPFSSADERRRFTNTLDELQGAENAGNVLLLEAGNVSDDLKNQMTLEDLSSKYNDKLFEYSDSQARKNIALAFGVPLGLIDVSESSLFGNSGELLKQMNLQLWESQEESRSMLSEAFNKLLSNWNEPINETLEVVSPFESKPINNSNQRLND
ncbi:phage portal family protein [Bizionia psychrotolerans]|uniref:hypothetical protein n=1 Tax=Bizionia psychrotolerans TaxID=1492901 RepID=UPI0006500B5F|nr:hypothetical protein [Bizionia psychrotolerans]